MALTRGLVQKITWTPTKVCVWVGASAAAEIVFVLFKSSDTETQLTFKRNVTNLLIKANMVGCPVSVTHPANSAEIESVTFDILIDPQELRKNIVAATQNYKAYFGCDPGGCSLNNLGRNLNESQINSFFTAPAPWNTDCQGAARIIMARGLILTLNPGEFDKLGYNSSNMHLEFRPIVHSDQMLIGEWAYFQNDLRYPQKHPDGGYRGENVIKVSDTEYYGFPGGTQTEQEWVQELIDMYNSGLPPSEMINSVPGFIGQANQCLNVKAICLDLLTLRYP